MKIKFCSQPIIKRHLIFRGVKFYFCHHIKTMQSNNMGEESTLISVKV